MEDGVLEIYHFYSKRIHVNRSSSHESFEANLRYNRGLKHHN